MYGETASSVLSENKSPDLGFRWSLNPYRGCAHACAYCYARPTHQYWDFGAGTDFERKLIAKHNAADLLRARFERPSWRGETIVFSGNTDCYQPLESELKLTQACLEVCAEYRNPVGIITKSALIQRDISLLAELSKHAHLRVNVSIPFADRALARAIEPGAPTPKMRFATIRALSDAGIEVGVAVAPIIPGLNDDQIVEILERAADAGAKMAFHVPVRLSKEVEMVFESRIKEALPLRASRVLNAIRRMNGGAMQRSGFGERFTGEGPEWLAVASLYRLTLKRLGLRG
ncbi:MAG: DNA repair photolyase, partial [Bradymonadia bacterium]